MIDMVHKALDPWKRRIMLMVGRAVITAVNAQNQTQLVQVNLLAGETSGDLEQFQDYGFVSVPFAQAEAAVVFLGGDRSNGLVIATQDRRYRLTTLAQGEVALHDDQGQHVWLKRGGIDISTPFNLTGEIQGDLSLTVAGSATINAGSLVLGGAGAQAVARVGDKVVNGVITTGSAKVSAL